MIAKSNFEIDTRVEDPILENPGGVLNSVLITKHFWGAIEGTSVVHMLGQKTTLPTSEAYVAFETLAVTIGGRPGTFVLRHEAMRSLSSPHAGSWKIVHDSGTDALTGISGTGVVQFYDDGPATFDLDYDL
jgi:Protein of unknown function (DUF3224)